MPLKPILSPFSGSEPGMVGQSLVYQSGDTAILPCDISVPPPPPSRRGGDPGGPRQQGSMKKMNNNRNNMKQQGSPTRTIKDELVLVMWYREDVRSPIYSIGQLKLILPYSCKVQFSIKYDSGPSHQNHPFILLSKGFYFH